MAVLEIILRLGGPSALVKILPHGAVDVWKCIADHFKHGDFAISVLGVNELRTGAGIKLPASFNHALQPIEGLLLLLERQRRNRHNQAGNAITADPARFFLVFLVSHEFPLTTSAQSYDGQVSTL